MNPAQKRYDVFANAEHHSTILATGQMLTRDDILKLIKYNGLTLSALIDTLIEYQGLKETINQFDNQKLTIKN